MGLDMYACITREPISSPVDFQVDDYSELHYWRKHPNLHGWMQQLYYAKGGEKEFNCTPVLLEEADLDRLERAIKAGELPETSGFFFGQSDGSERDDDLTFVASAREAIAKGYSVYYDSWW